MYLSVNLLTSQLKDPYEFGLAEAFIQGTVGKHPIRMRFSPFFHLIASALFPLSLTILPDPVVTDLSGFIEISHGTDTVPFAFSG